MPCRCGGEITADEAERHAIPFGLTYLSRDGYAKLAMLIAHLLEQQRKEIGAPDQFVDAAFAGGLKIFPADATILKRKSGG